MSQEKYCSKQATLPIQAAGNGFSTAIIIIVKYYLPSWPEIPLGRSANSPATRGKPSNNRKAPEEYFRTVLAGFFHLSKGEESNGPFSRKPLSVPDGFLSKDSPVPFTAPLVL